jgi:hypothetical protein
VSESSNGGRPAPASGCHATLTPFVPHFMTAIGRRTRSRHVPSQLAATCSNCEHCFRRSGYVSCSQPGMKHKERAIWTVRTDGLVSGHLQRVCDVQSSAPPLSPRQRACTTTTGPYWTERAARASEIIWGRHRPPPVGAVDPATIAAWGIFGGDHDVLFFMIPISPPCRSALRHCVSCFYTPGLPGR